MKRLTGAIVLLLVVLVPARTALGEWYDDYEAGIKAAQNSDWDQVIAKMNAAIAKQSKENKRARTYGNIFIQYHPYYYRGHAYMQKGIPCNSNAALTNLQKGMNDLRNTSGPGQVSFGEPSSLMIRLNEMIVACGVTARPATPAEPPATPPPATPQIDPNLEPAKRRAQTAINAAMTKVSEAQAAQAQRFAAQEIAQANGLLREANNLNISASTAADFNKVADTADQAARAFNAAISAARMNQATQTPVGTTPTGTPKVPAAPRPGPTGQGEVIRPAREELKQALGAYFDGNFRDSVARFQQLTAQHGNNAMIWALLGASQYYDYYMRGQTDAAALEAAKQALRQARKINPGLTLDPQYFSPRLQSFYRSIQ